MQRLRLKLFPVGSPEAAEHLSTVTHIYTDLDGTLFAPGGHLLAAHDGRASTATAEALVSLKQAGITVVIVTGRNGVQGHEILRILALEKFIGEAGTLVIEGTGARMRKRYRLGDWQSVVLGANLAPGELPGGVTPHELILKSGAVDSLLAAFPGKIEPHGLNIGGNADVGHIFRGNLDISQAEAVLVEGPLPLQLIDNGVIHPASHTLVDCDEVHIYHLIPRGATKARAVEADIAELGLGRQQCVAVGDSPQDIEMGAHAGSLVVVANALESEAVLPAITARAEADRPTFYTQGSTADGWAEFARALLAARGA
ncbi:MAG: HAD hydrolase family protein [Actinomycetia bacterium]|nr:HAD hydrolase family protein [Actinomycetes bacterium]